MRTRRKLYAVDREKESLRERAKRLVKEWRSPDPRPIVNQHDRNDPAPTLNVDAACNKAFLNLGEK